MVQSICLSKYQTDKKTRTASRWLGKIIRRVLERLPDGILLAAHGIAGDDCAAKVEHIKQLGYGGNLVALLVDGNLGKRNDVLARPGAAYLS